MIHFGWSFCFVLVFIPSPSQKPFRKSHSEEWKNCFEYFGKLP